MADLPSLKPARSGDGRAAETLLSPWQERPRGIQPIAFFSDAASSHPASAHPILPRIERRLGHRGELLWSRLKAERCLPAADEASLLLDHPFTDHALLLERCADGSLFVARAGKELARLGFAAPGPVRGGGQPGDARLPIAQRVVALAQAAMTASRPAHLTGDDDPDIAAVSPILLYRAVALPFEARQPGGQAGTAVALVSWRQMLSAEETSELHAELRRAMATISQRSP